MIGIIDLEQTKYIYILLGIIIILWVYAVFRIEQILRKLSKTEKSSKKEV
jgi:hypothetical protein